MGAITPDKKLYDQATVAFFQSRGWQAFAIEKTGRYTDVLAIKGSSLAIIEVKSIKETSAVKSCDDSANLSPALNASIGFFLKTIRQKVFALFPRGSSLETLYAATIAAQIFRYIHEFDEKAADYEKFIPQQRDVGLVNSCQRNSTGLIRLQGVRFTKLPFLVVPEEYAKELSTALDVLKKNRAISSFNLYRASRLVIAEFAYP